MSNPPKKNRKHLNIMERKDIFHKTAVKVVATDRKTQKETSLAGMLFPDLINNTPESRLLSKEDLGKAASENVALENALENIWDRFHNHLNYLDEIESKPIKKVKNGLENLAAAAKALIGAMRGLGPGAIDILHYWESEWTTDAEATGLPGYRAWQGNLAGPPLSLVESPWIIRLNALAKQAELGAAHIKASNAKGGIAPGATSFTQIAGMETASKFLGNECTKFANDHGCTVKTTVAQLIQAVTEAEYGRDTVASGNGKRSQAGRSVIRKHSK